LSVAGMLWIRDHLHECWVPFVLGGGRLALMQPIGLEQRRSGVRYGAVGCPAIVVILGLAHTQRASAVPWAVGGIVLLVAACEVVGRRRVP
jgi:hypothetical protein